jgi:hypothetical protein
MSTVYNVNYENESNKNCASSGMLRRVALVRNDVSEELSASFILVFLRSMCRLFVTSKKYFFAAYVGC